MHTMHMHTYGAMQVIYQSFVPELDRCGDPDVAMVRVQLTTFIAGREFDKEPEGRAMPRVDMSKYQRA